MTIEEIIALIQALAPIAIPLIGAWRFFVWWDGKKQTGKDAIVLEEQRKLRDEIRLQREAQQAQNNLLTKIIDGSEASMEALVGVINTFTKATAQRDIMHDDESKRHDDLLATLNKTIKQGQLQHSSDLQALTQAITAFGNKINEVSEMTERIEMVMNKTAGSVDTLSSLVKTELMTIQNSLDKLSQENGNLVTHKAAIEIQTLVEAKIAGIMDLLKPVKQPISISKKTKGKSDEPTQPISADL